MNSLCSSTEAPDEPAQLQVYNRLQEHVVERMKKEEAAMQARIEWAETAWWILDIFFCLTDAFARTILSLSRRAFKAAEKEKLKNLTTTAYR